MSDQSQDILDRLDSMAEDFSRHVEENTDAHARLFSALDSVSGELERHGKEETKIMTWMTGNGEPGLMERLRVQERWTRSQQRLMWPVLIAMTLSAIALIAQVLAAQLMTPK